MAKENLIMEKSFQYALSIIEIYKKMIKANEYDMGRQLLISGTSIGANVNEAMAAISKKDFILKMSISSKEARETKYWLRLIEESKLINYDFTEIMLETDSIINILTAIVKTSQKNNNG